MEKQSPDSWKTFLGVLFSPMAQLGAVLRLNFWLVPPQGKDSITLMPSPVSAPHQWPGSRAV